MYEACPNCGARTLVVPGEECLCTQCGHGWEPQAPSDDQGGPPGGERGEAPAYELELQRALGDVVEGPFDVLHLREMIYTGHLRGTERVRVPGGSNFLALDEHAALREVLVLVGRLQPDEPQGERRISGWQSVSPASGEQQEDRVVAELPRAKKKGPLVLIVVALAIALAVLGGLLVFAS